MTHTPRHSQEQSFVLRRIRCTRNYFGFDGVDRGWRERLSIFAANERRSWARLLGARGDSGTCGGAGSAASDMAARESGRDKPNP